MNQQVRIGEPEAATQIVPLMGNEAIARGAWEAGVRVAAAYPGTPSTEILETPARYSASDIYAEWSTNEKVALDVAIGAAFSGVRAMAAMKHVGLNVAADSLMSLSYIGAHAGLVLVVCDDPGIHSSQNEQDTRLFARFAGVPVLEPCDAQEAHDFTKLAFEISETFDTPVIVRSTTRLSHTRSAVRVGARTDVAARGFVDAPSKTVTIPANARRLHPKVIEREAKIGRYLETSPLTRWEKGDSRFGVVTGSTAYLYVKEVAPNASILKLGAAYPLPEGVIRDFAASVDRLLVVEELEPALEKEIRAMGFAAEGKKHFPRFGELSPELVRAGLAAAGAARPRRRRFRFTSNRWRARRCCARAARTRRRIWPCAASRRGSPATSAAIRSRPWSRCARSTPPSAWARASPTRSAWRPPAKKSRWWRRSAIRRFCIRASRR